MQFSKEDTALLAAKLLKDLGRYPSKHVFSNQSGDKVKVISIDEFMSDIVKTDHSNKAPIIWIEDGVEKLYWIGVAEFTNRDGSITATDLI